MAKSGYYAVAAGRSTGVFTTWAECEAQVKGFTGCRYNKFKTNAEAQAFVSNYTGQRGVVKFDPTPNRKRLWDENTEIKPSCAQKRKHDTNDAVAKRHKTGVVTSKEEIGRHLGRSVYRKFDTKQATLANFDNGQKLTSLATMLKEKEKCPLAGKDIQRKSPVGVDIILKSAAFKGFAGAVATADVEDTSFLTTGGPWYAVAKGRKTGVFRTWKEAKKQVENLFSAKFKKFPTREQAEAFVTKHAASTKSQESNPDPKDSTTLVAFCDGSALKNGRQQCRAGYACIFPHCKEWNVAKQLVEERATNNRAEYMAALEAMKRANVENPDGSRLLYIFSDSMLLIRSMTEWVGTWQKNNWTKSDGKPVQNRDLLELLMAEKGDRCICWNHVKAHTGKKDWKSKWNDVADNAARNAAQSVGEV